MDTHPTPFTTSCSTRANALLDTMPSSLASMPSCSIIILAAGEGTRMKSPTPKVLHTICGKSMITRIITQALHISDDIHIILHHEKEQITKHIKQHFTNISALSFHTQDRARFPGTGGALFDASSAALIPLKYARTIVLNGDMPLISAESIASIARLLAPMVVGALELANPQGYGRIVLDNGYVKNIIEEKDCHPSELAITLGNAGIYGFDTSLLASLLPQLRNDNAQQEYYITDLIAIYAAQENAHIAPFFCDVHECMGVNSKQELAQAEEIRLSVLRNNAMKQGVIMRIPQSIYIEEDVSFEGECELENNVRISGKSHIAHSHIRASSVIEHSVIEHSDIGPMAHIRPHSHITRTHIGNFVETKSAHLIGVKAGHLSYLGDCEIDEGSNVGAGVITCNYDGKQKHKTRIGKQVFIGSDTQLIAPVHIESNALIGAGSTITMDIKHGELALSRIKQCNIPNGFYRFFHKSDDV